jgi:hypothetical protein
MIRMTHQAGQALILPRTVLAVALGIILAIGVLMLAHEIDSGIALPIKQDQPVEIEGEVSEACESPNPFDCVEVGGGSEGGGIGGHELGE